MNYTEKILMENCVKTRNLSKRNGYQIYLDRIPSSNKDVFWISFESDPKLRKTKANIYGRCLPCIQSLYEQLQAKKREIALGTAYHCWKITVVLKDIESCFTLLSEFEKRFSHFYVYGKIGNGREKAKTRVVVFHAESEDERDRILKAIEVCLPRVDGAIDVQVSRGCAVLHNELFGDWRKWRPVMPIKHPENVQRILDKIRKVLFWSIM